MKIITITQHDYAGVAHKYALCARKVGLDARSIRFYDRPDVDTDFTIYNGHRNRESYRTKVLQDEYSRQTLAPKFYKRERQAQAMLDEADVLHIVGDWPPSYYDESRMFLDLGKPVVVTPVGSLFRRFEEGKKWAVGKWPLAFHMAHTNVRTVDTVDLLYENFEAEYLGIPIDCPMTSQMPRYLDFPDDYPNKVPHITHSPSCRINKGTDEVFVPAMEILQREREITYDIIEGVTHGECMTRKLKGDVFFGQKGIGWYATSTLEAAAYGIPSVCWLSDENLKRAGYTDALHREHLPIQTFDGTAEGLADKIRGLLAPEPEAQDDYARLAIDTKRFVQRNYSFDVIGSKLGQLYSRALDAPKWRR